MIELTMLIFSLIIDFVCICVVFLLGASALLIRFSKLAFSAMAAYAFAYNVTLCTQPFMNFLVFFAIITVAMLALSYLCMVGFAITFTASAFVTQLVLFLLNSFLIYMPLSFFANPTTVETVSTIVMSLGAAVAFFWALASAGMHLETFPCTSACPIVQSLLAAPLYSLASYLVIGMIPLEGGTQFSMQTLCIIAGVVGVAAFVVNLIAGRRISES